MANSFGGFLDGGFLTLDAADQILFRSFPVFGTLQIDSASAAIHDVDSAAMV